MECNVPFKVLQLDEVTTVNGGKEMIVELQTCNNTVVCGEESWEEDSYYDFKIIYK